MTKSPKSQKALSATSRTSRSIETRAIYYGGATFIASLIASYLYFQSPAVPLFGRDGSVGLAAAVLGTIAAFVGYMIASTRVREAVKRSRAQKLHVALTTMALAFVHASISFLLLAGAFFIIHDAFRGLLLDQYAASAIVATTVAVLSYIIYLVAAQMTTLRISTALAVFLVSGALTSMITAEDPYWWQRHFSALGAGDSASSYAFNITLIIAGAVIVSLSDYIAEDFAKLKQKALLYKKAKTTAVRVVLALIGIFLALVGVFAYDTDPLLHNTAAGGMAVLFVGLIIALPLLVPSFSKAFFALSYALMGVLILCYWLWVGLEYFNLTTFELIAAGIIFGWLVVFIRQVAAALDDDAQ